MKKHYLLIAFAFCFQLSMAQNFNLQFRSQKTYTGDLANIGGLALNGAEYALVGWQYGLSIVSVTNPDSIYEVLNIPGVNSIWREVKTYNNYAYVTTEGSGDGLIIVNLNYLPDSAPFKHYYGDGAINTQLNTIHALHIDSGYAYLWGSNLFNGTGVICDLNNDPWNPVYVGNTSNADPNYIHDGYIRNNVLYGAHVYDGYFSIMDVTNKANPVELNTQNTPNNFTHNCWLNDASTVLFTTDEVNNSFLASYDVSNPANITLLDKYQTDPGSQSIVHNTHTLNDYEVVSWYKEGVVIVDGSHPDNMIEVAHYDESPTTGGGYDGAWGVYPFLPSGNLLVSDISLGLFVLTPTYERGCYLEGVATDSISGALLNNVKVEFLTNPKIRFTNINGVYKTGLVDANTYDIKFTKAGYYDKIITGVVLQNDSTTNLNVQLNPLPFVTMSGYVYDVNTNLPVANASVLLNGTNGTYNLTTNAAGNFTIATFIPGTYDISAGLWGYRTFCTNQSVSGNINIPLTPGIYDDFTFDNNWTVTGNASTGSWVIGVPLGTTNNGIPSNPGADVTTDCGNQAFVTGNTGTTAGDDDVDNGYTLVTSPIFDLTGYSNPVMSYSRWFANFSGPGGQPNDSMIIYITNGALTVPVEIVTSSSAGQSSWFSNSILLNSLLTSTSTMQVSVYIADAPQGNVTEGGFDLFEINEGFAGIANVNSNGSSLNAYPNPFTTQSQIEYSFENAGNNRQVVLSNLFGEVLKTYDVTNSKGTINLGNELAKGVYLIQLKESNKILKTNKVVKL